MGAGEGMSQGVKTSKPQQQEQQQSTNSFSEWAAAFQAYYGSGAQPPPHGAGYYAPATSGPQTHHPYIWGGQMMPYGAPPPPYPTMYPAGAMYHPSISPNTHPYGQFSTGTMPTPTSPGMTDGPTVRGKVPASSNGEAKTAEGNGSGFPSGNSVKRCKSNAALVPSASAGDTAKPGHNSGDGMSNSGDSGGSDDTSDSEDEPGQNGSLANRRRAYDQNNAGASASVPAHGSTRSGSIAPAGNGGPTTTLGVSIDYWQNSTATSTPIATTTSTKSAMVPKRAVTTGAAVSIPPPPPPLPPPAPSSMTSLVPATTPRDGTQDLWYQDEREVKRQRRKQSNRESARRSRLRKQAECEELGARVETLTNENMTLRTELTRLYDECKKLAADNASMKDELRYLRDDRSRGENGKGELQQQPQQQATRGNASGEMWKKSLHLRKESTMSENSNSLAMASSADRVPDGSIGRGGNVDGAGVASSIPGAGGMERGGNGRRGSRSPSRNGSNHHHSANGLASRRTGGQATAASAGKLYDEDGEGFNDRSGKSPRGSTLGLDFGTGRETVAAG